MIRKLAQTLERPRLALEYVRGHDVSAARVCEDIRLYFGPEIKQYIDIGAHAGGYLGTVAGYFPSADLVAFEPLPDMFERLRERYPEASVFDVALGSLSKSATILRDIDSPGKSSLLPMNEKHTTREVPVDVRRFDEMPVEVRRPCFVKIDAQGYELEILRGFGDVLARVDFLLVEVMFKEIYARQAKAADVIAYAFEHGFVGFKQYDALPYRSRAPAYCDLLFYR